MGQVLKVIRNYILALIAGLSIRACMLYTDNITNKYGKQEEIIDKYNRQPISYIQNSVKTLKDAQKIAEAVYGINGDCPKGAGLIAYLLNDDKYSPEFIKLEEKDWGFHWFFMHKNKNKYYFADNGLFGIVKCNSINELVSYVEKKDNVKGLKYKITNEAPAEFSPKNAEKDFEIIENYRTQRHLN